jgi:hypothetical protein
MFPYKALRRYLAYDALKGELLTLDAYSKEECLLCNAKDGMFGLGDLEPLPDYAEKDKAIPHADQYETEKMGEPVPDEFPENLSESHSYSINNLDERNDNNENT